MGFFALKLKTSESLCHFPELDMSETGGEQDVISGGRETGAVNFLRVGLGLENDSLSQPVPHGDREVGEATQGN